MHPLIVISVAIDAHKCSWVIAMQMYVGHILDNVGIGSLSVYVSYSFMSHLCTQSYICKYRTDHLTSLVHVPRVCPA